MSESHPFITDVNPYAELRTHRAYYLEAVHDARLAAIGLWRSAHSAAENNCFEGYVTQTDGLVAACTTAHPVPWRQVEVTVMPTLDGSPVVVRRAMHEDPGLDSDAVRIRTTSTYNLVPGGMLETVEEPGVILQDGTFSPVSSFYGTLSELRQTPLTIPIARELQQTLQRIDGSYVEPAPQTWRQKFGSVMRRIISG